MIEIIFGVFIYLMYINLRGKILKLDKEIILLKQSSPSVSKEASIPSVQERPVLSDTLPSQGSIISSDVPAQSIPTPEEHGDFGEQWLGKIGMFAVLAGVAFFLKYAFDNNIIGVHGRIILGYFAGMAMLVLGQWLRKKYFTYSQVILGGGIGILYLTTFAAFAFYSLISPSAAYILMVCITTVAVTLSIVDNAVILAGVGVFGAFVTPLFIAIHTPDPLQLFAYILIIDLGVLAIIYRYKWIELQYLSFLGTAILISVWAFNFYDVVTRIPLLLSITAYFLVFLVASMLHHVVRKEISKSADIFFITLNGLLYAWASYIILDPITHSFMGFFMLGLAALYFLVGFVAFSSNKDDMLLNWALPGLSVVFLTLAIPLHFSGSWITIAWLLEAVLLFALDYFIRGKNLYVFGSMIFAIGIIRFFAIDNNMIPDWHTYEVVFNKRFFIVLFAIVASYVMLWIASIENKRKIFDEAKGLVIFFAIASQLLSIFLITTEVNMAYAKKIANMREIRLTEQVECERIYGVDNDSACTQTTSYEDFNAINYENNTMLSVLWVLYAVFLIAIGFFGSFRLARIFGLMLFFITALKVFVDVWSLGPLYRIISSIVFGVVALVGSFLFARFKDKIRQSL